MKFTLLAFVFLSQLSWAASDMVCGIDADCGRGFSCRSKPYGGTRCVQSGSDRQSGLDLTAPIQGRHGADQARSETTPIAFSTANEEATCARIGFTPKTESFGNCVLEFIDRKKTENTPQTEDDQLCAGYGFKAGSENFAACKLQMAQARWQVTQQQAQYEEQKRQYEEQMELARNKTRQENARRSLDLSLRLLGGQSPTDAILSTGSGLPIAPRTPPPQTITLPGGRIVTCTTQNNVSTCF